LPRSGKIADLPQNGTRFNGGKIANIFACRLAVSLSKKMQDYMEASIDIGMLKGK
jgi:hypothetical protein